MCDNKEKDPSKLVNSSPETDSECLPDEALEEVSAAGVVSWSVGRRPLPNLLKL